MTVRPTYHLVSLGVSVLAPVGWYFPGSGLAAVSFLDGFTPPLALNSLIYHFIPFWMTMGLFCLVLIVRTAVVRILKRNACGPARQRADKGSVGIFYSAYLAGTAVIRVWRVAFYKPEYRP